MKEVNIIRERMAILNLAMSNAIPKSNRELRCVELQTQLDNYCQAGAILTRKLQQSLQTQDALALALQADEEVSKWMSSLLQVMHFSIVEPLSAPTTASCFHCT